MLKAKAQTAPAKKAEPKKNGTKGSVKIAEPKTPVLKGKAPSHYQVRITGAMVARGYHSKEDMLWNLEDLYTNASGECQLCGHPIVYNYLIRNMKDNKTMVVGSECVKQVNGINPAQIEYAEMLMKRQIADQKAQRDAEKKAQRAAEYKEKYSEELQFLKDYSKGHYLTPNLFALIKVLETGSRNVKPGELEAIAALQRANKKTEKDFSKKIGTAAEYDRFSDFVVEQAAENPYSDFWSNALRGLRAQNLSDKFIEAIKKNMGSTDNTEIIAKLGGEKDYETFKEFIKSQVEEHPDNDFWKNMSNAFKRNALTDNMINAVWSSMAKIMPEANNKVIGTEVSIHCEITIPNWLARKHGISKVMEGYILKESKNGYFFKGHASTRPSSWCFRCGLELTHPVSLVVGYGAECCSKMGVPWNASDEEQIAKMRSLIEAVVFEGWLPKAKVEIREL